MRKWSVLFFCSFLLVRSISAQQVLYSDDFSSSLEKWTVESASEETVINLNDGVLDVVAPAGITIWFNQKLEGNVRIAFEAFVVDEGGEWDRVSDLNCFWMANDPKNPDDFFSRSAWRGGTFGKYYSLSLYYAGYGGNTNSTTRFRKYDGDFEAFTGKQQRPEILKEYTDEQHLIKPNQWYRIEIEVKGKHIRYSVNNEVLFDYKDQEPYKSGYFGLRTVKNHIRYRNFQVFDLPEN